jgi:threonyl-tRNA synthetase
MTDSLGAPGSSAPSSSTTTLPLRFELTYTGADNAEHRPVMIHRALFGSFERFIGILLEHLGGELPVWLAPVQAIVLPITDRQNDAAAGVLGALEAAGLRGELDARSESVGRKIRDAELRKMPYMLVVGEREAAPGRSPCASAAPAMSASSRRGIRRAAAQREHAAVALTRARLAARQRTLATGPAAPLYSRLGPRNNHHAAQRTPLDART